LVAGIFLINHGITELLGVPQWTDIVRACLESAGGMLFVAGLWTPMTGALVVVVESWFIASRTGELPTCILLAAFGAGVAMLGPGAWSIDARLFGRKQIDLRER